VKITEHLGSEKCHIGFYIKRNESNREWGRD